MGKESQVEIPEGSGHHYRYEYDSGSQKTLYRGPVGQAPLMSEQEFLKILDVPGYFKEEKKRLESDLKKVEKELNDKRKSIIEQGNRLPKDIKEALEGEDRYHAVALSNAISNFNTNAIDSLHRYEREWTRAERIRAKIELIKEFEKDEAS